MIEARTCVPSTESLAAGLKVVFGAHGAERGPLAILSREANLYTSTFPTEIVTFMQDGSTIRRAFCKYGAGQLLAAYGHKAGVPYEANVYEHVLQCLGLPHPECFGAYSESPDGITWLFLE